MADVSDKNSDVTQGRLNRISGTPFANIFLY